MKKILVILVILPLLNGIMAAQEKEAERIVPAEELQARIDTLFSKYHIEISFPDMNNVREERIKFWEDYAFYTDWNAKKNKSNIVERQNKEIQNKIQARENMTKEQWDSLKRVHLAIKEHQKSEQVEKSKAAKKYTPEEREAWMRHITDSLRVEYEKENGVKK